MLFAQRRKTAAAAARLHQQEQQKGALERKKKSKGQQQQLFPSKQGPGLLKQLEGTEIRENPPTPAESGGRQRWQFARFLSSTQNSYRIKLHV